MKKNSVKKRFRIKGSDGKPANSNPSKNGGCPMHDAKNFGCFHGNRDIYWFTDDKFYLVDGREIPVVAGTTIPVLSAVADTAAAAPSVAPESPFRFGRMFGKMFGDLKAGPLPEDAEARAKAEAGLIELGAAMIQTSDSPADDTSGLPAGYTFLGQFIDHDMTFDALKEIPDGVIEEVEKHVSKRSPSLDLDSLYGLSFLNGEEKSDENLREAGSARMRIGPTSQAKVLSGSIPGGFANDLLREDGTKKPIVGDERADENLGLAQTHVAFLRFHNAVVDHLVDKGETKFETAADLFNEARTIVTEHYQSIILHDFLPKILDDDILQDIINAAKNDEKGPSWPDQAQNPFMPIEFSAAAFRLGHSLLRNSYEWNRFFHAERSPGTLDDDNASLAKLFRLTHHEGLGGSDTLPGNWIINWKLFYDFTDYKIEPPPKLNRSRKLDTVIAPLLAFLPEFTANMETPAEERTLSIRNLRRGRLLRLPPGQDVADFFLIQKKLRKEQLLTEEEITGGVHEAILKKHGFDKKTPLWYYILKEAEVKSGGKHLGPVGSMIIAETFVELIRRSKISILKNGWTKKLLEAEDASKGFGMADLLMFVDKGSGLFINPLGDPM